MRTNRFFSLLEIMVGLAILVMAAGAVGWKMYGYIEKRRFRTDLEQFKSRIQTVRRMAVNMQADWEGVLKPSGKDWTFEAVCLDPPKSKSFPPIKLRDSELFFDGKKQGRLTLIFFSGGEVWPVGSLLFRRYKDGQTESCELPGIFGLEGGDGAKKLGPVHPDEA